MLENNENQCCKNCLFSLKSNIKEDRKDWICGNENSEKFDEFVNPDFSCQYGGWREDRKRVF